MSSWISEPSTGVGALSFVMGVSENSASNAMDHRGSEKVPP